MFIFLFLFFFSPFFFPPFFQADFVSFFPCKVRVITLFLLPTFRREIITYPSFPRGIVVGLPLSLKLATGGGLALFPPRGKVFFFPFLSLPSFRLVPPPIPPFLGVQPPPASESTFFGPWFPAPFLVRLKYGFFSLFFGPSVPPPLRWRGSFPPSFPSQPAADLPLPPATFLLPQRNSPFFFRILPIGCPPLPHTKDDSFLSHLSPLLHSPLLASDPAQSTR